MEKLKTLISVRLDSTAILGRNTDVRSGIYVMYTLTEPPFVQTPSNWPSLLKAIRSIPDS